MKKLILIPKFIDRAGRVVFEMHEEKEDSRYLMPGAFLGIIRISDDEDLAQIERIAEQHEMDVEVKNGK